MWVGVLLFSQLLVPGELLLSRYLLKHFLFIKVEPTQTKKNAQSVLLFRRKPRPHRGAWQCRACGGKNVKQDDRKNKKRT